MKTEDSKKFYQSMLNVMYGLQDDLDSNEVPEEARFGFREIIEICQSDFNIRFQDELR